MRDVALNARAASRRLRTIDRDALVRSMAESLRSHRERIAEANARDLEADLPAVMKDRLRIDATSLAASVDSIASLPDPLDGDERRTPRGDFKLLKRRVPLGVIFMIYESRPGVTAEAAALCLKAGSAVILKGGVEAERTNEAILECCPAEFVQLVRGREAVESLLAQDDLIDLVIPRGGTALIRFVKEHSRIPVLAHDRGNCHVYVDAKADLAMAHAIVRNAKCQRPATCNAVEHVLVHERVAAEFLPMLRTLGVELRFDDPDTEYLDLILGVHVVPSLEAAIEHIERHGSHHTDAIVTGDERAARRFLDEVGSATVLWNASTRLADGGVFGLGGEIGISTGRLHARGPMGLEELTTYQWIVEGNGNLRET
jgi:glutamate-5-semialdehyde dehydrogenase